MALFEVVMKYVYLAIYSGVLSFIRKFFFLPLASFIWLPTLITQIFFSFSLIYLEFGVPCTWKLFALAPNNSACLDSTLITLPPCNPFGPQDLDLILILSGYGFHLHYWYESRWPHHNPWLICIKVGPTKGSARFKLGTVPRWIPLNCNERCSGCN